MPSDDPLPQTAPCAAWTPRHAARLREVYRSAGWPYQDVLEVELLTAGLLERIEPADAAPRIRVTDAGLQAIASSRQRHKAARTPHQALIDAVTEWLHRTQGRLVWQGPQILSPIAAAVPAAPPDGPPPSLLPPQWEEPNTNTSRAARWRTCIPDIYSLRHSSVQAYLEPAVFEIKVSRADLLGDLRRADKRAAYLAIAGQCWYVLGRDRSGRPIAAANEIPLECGVLQAGTDGLTVERPAPRRSLPELPFSVWMALARCTPAQPACSDAFQAPLQSTVEPLP